MWERRGAHRVLVEYLEEKKLLGRPGCRLEDDVKICLQEVGWGYCLDGSGSG
jgi:hypothetical protein